MNWSAELNKIQVRKFFFRNMLAPLSWLYIAKTLEMIFSPEKVSPKASKRFTYHISLFPGMKSLKEICGNIAIDCTKTMSQKAITLEFTLSSCDIVEADELAIKLIGKTDKVTATPVNIPRLTPGKPFHFYVSFSRSQIKEHTYRITGAFKKGTSFDLLAPTVKQN